jgi:hypothetical protein
MVVPLALIAIRDAAAPAAMISDESRPSSRSASSQRLKPLAEPGAADRASPSGSRPHDPMAGDWSL